MKPIIDYKKLTFMKLAFYMNVLNNCVCYFYSAIPWITLMYPFEITYFISVRNYPNVLFRKTSKKIYLKVFLANLDKLITPLNILNLSGFVRFKYPVISFEVKPSFYNFKTWIFINRLTSTKCIFQIILLWNFTL